jgi:hypothetical protein
MPGPWAQKTGSIRGRQARPARYLCTILPRCRALLDAGADPHGRAAALMEDE